MPRSLVDRLIGGILAETRGGSRMMAMSDRWRSCRDGNQKEARNGGSVYQYGHRNRRANPGAALDAVVCIGGVPAGQDDDRHVLGQPGAAARRGGRSEDYGLVG